MNKDLLNYDTESYNIKLTKYGANVDMNYYEKPIYRLSQKGKEQKQKDVEKHNLLIEQRNTAHKQSFESDSTNNPFSLENDEIEEIREDIEKKWRERKAIKDTFLPAGYEIIYDDITKMEVLFPLPQYAPESFINRWNRREYSFHYAYCSQQAIFFQVYNDVMMKLEQENRKQKALIENELFKKDLVNRMRSVRRTKQTVYNITKSNNWDVMVTQTFDSSKFDRTDIKQIKKAFNERVKQVRKDYEKWSGKQSQMKYLMIFELHKDKKAWHMHGLIKCPDCFTFDDAFNPYNGERLIDDEGRLIYNIRQMSTLGFSTATFVESTESVAKYITKYITKELLQNFPKGKCYLCSKGLDRPEVITMTGSPEELEEIINEHCENAELIYSNKAYNMYNGSYVYYFGARKGCEINED